MTSENNEATQAEVNQATSTLIQAQKALLSTIGIDGTAIEKITLFPNPATESFKINNAEKAEVAIYAANGALMMLIENYDNGIIDISNLATGTYIVVANGAKIQLIKK